MARPSEPAFAGEKRVVCVLLGRLRTLQTHYKHVDVLLQ